MSDGISEGYRAARAADRFEKKWEEAQVEQIILDMKNQFSDLQMQDLITKLMAIVPRMQLKNYNKFVIPCTDGHYFADSAPVSKEMPHKIRLYEIEVSGQVHRRFVNSDFKAALIECLLFTEWLETEEGKSASAAYNNY